MCPGLLLPKDSHTDSDLCRHSALPYATSRQMGWGRRRPDVQVVLTSPLTRARSPSPFSLGVANFAKDLIFSFLILEKFIILCKNENQDRPEHTPDLSPCPGTPSLDWCTPSSLTDLQLCLQVSELQHVQGHRGTHSKTRCETQLGETR